MHESEHQEKPKIFFVQGMGVGQPMIPATLLAGYQARIHSQEMQSQRRIWIFKVLNCCYGRGCWFWYFYWIEITNKIVGLWSDPTLAIPARVVDGQVLPAVHLLDRRRLGVQAHRPGWGDLFTNAPTNKHRHTRKVHTDTQTYSYTHTHCMFLHSTTA